MQVVQKIGFAIALSLACLAPADAHALGHECRSDPNPPSTPEGCRSMTPECVCDGDGDNCHWVWICGH